jgi:hypothetical protein
MAVLMTDAQDQAVVSTKGGYRPRLPHAIIVKAPSLLPMFYKLSELEQELGVPVRTLQDWLAHGVPHHRDETGHLWINGRDMAAWVEQQRAARTLPTSAVGQAYCFHCRKTVALNNPSMQRHGRRALLQAKCPNCGGIVNRGHRGGQPA